MGVHQRDYSPRSAVIGRFLPKKSRAGFTLPGNQFFGSRESKTYIISDLVCLPVYRRTRFAEKLFVLVRSRSVAAFIRAADPRAHALLRMRGAPEGHRPGLDSGRRELRSFVSFVAVTSPDRKENWR